MDALDGPNDREASKPPIKKAAQTAARPSADSIRTEAVSEERREPERSGCCLGASKEVATAVFTRQVRVGTPTKERLYWGLCCAVESSALVPGRRHEGAHRR